MKHLILELNGRIEHVSLSPAEYEELIGLVERIGEVLRAVGVHVAVHILAD